MNLLFAVGCSRLGCGGNANIHVPERREDCGQGGWSKERWTAADHSKALGYCLINPMQLLSEEGFGLLGLTISSSQLLNLNLVSCFDLLVFHNIYHGFSDDWLFFHEEWLHLYVFKYGIQSVFLMMLGDAMNAVLTRHVHI